MKKEIIRFVQELLQKEYDLGEIVRVEEIKAGDTNNSFFAWAKKDGKEVKWYVRQYNAAEQEQDIIYEHAFERYFDKNVNGEMQTMLPVTAKNGKSWAVAECEGVSNFYAVFNVITGLEPYSWEYTNLSDVALDSCAAAVAKFQSWAYGFKGPEGSGRREPPLEEQFKAWRTDLPAALMEKKKNEVFRRFTEYFERELPFLLSTVDFCEKELAVHRDDLKMCINHKDLNPSNVMFDKNDEVSAFFDLDWVNTDYRLYDLAWMSCQAIASWNTDSWGEVPLDKLSHFVDIYNQEMISRNCPLGPLNKVEIEFLPTMMIICIMKIIVDISCYEDHEHEVHRMFVNVWRFVMSVRMIREFIENKKI